VRVEPLPSRNTSNTSNTDNPANFRYIITLYYAHNRACEIYRSTNQVLTLKHTLVAAVKYGVTPKPPSPNDALSRALAGGSMRPAPGYPLCCRKCSHPCLCPALVQGVDARSASEFNQLLEDALARAGAGNNGVKLTLGWFLRRRLGDCGGYGDGDGNGDEREGW
jgi:hypothetical protein